MLTSTDEPSDEAIKGEPSEIRPRNTVRSDLFSAAGPREVDDGELGSVCRIRQMHNDVIACEAAAEDNWLGSRERVLSGELAIELTLKRATIWYRRPPGTPVESSRSNFRCHSLCGTSGRL
jgi:hypothetical protein